MRLTYLVAALASVASIAEAWNAPNYSGFKRNFNANFIGPKGKQPDPAKWNYRTGDLNDNNEVQRWTTAKRNIQYSGEGTMQIVPWRDSKAPKGWTSARIESKFTLTPTDKRITRVEASIRVGGNPPSRKQGIWPAFWMMGDVHRKNKVPWPACGEVDIFETINGLKEAYGVVHCDKQPGGACNEPIGLVKGTPLTDSKFHVYRLDFDRRNSDWRKQSMTWYVDGKQFHRITGAQINKKDVWASLCHKPLYFIMNVAVGGNWPGPPNEKTLGGVGSMLEFGYVAHYTSNQ
ncbi:Beta-glucanase-like protein [Hapsidospora chrysogenum ATCC 11550]|uniref:Beta-glucanase-like protein n=1 Tax=Hapsidospora chrysogenum (strain ATCC 11550 / CBS 779.69 / DSM 880 / IAM 14645 / JCM 23072 / IMI 49137) TaxID=857340 RepID=A0A086SZV0_HAPC1|nr:Beta-glucanase-like protein [Hapsidospora chrysogenum ATCC 11550]